MKQTIIAVAAALAAMTGWAGESAEFRLDTMDGPRTARAVETIAYSTAWNGGSTVSVAVDGVLLSNRRQLMRRRCFAAHTLGMERQ